MGIQTIECNLGLVTAAQAKRLAWAKCNIDTEHAYIFGELKHMGRCNNKNWEDNHRRLAAPTTAEALEWFKDVKEYKFSIQYDRDTEYYFAGYVDSNNEKVLLPPFTQPHEAELALIDLLLNELEIQKTTCLQSEEQTRKNWAILEKMEKEKLEKEAKIKFIDKKLRF